MGKESSFITVGREYLKELEEKRDKLEKKIESVKEHLCRLTKEKEKMPTKCTNNPDQQLGWISLCGDAKGALRELTTVLAETLDESGIDDYRRKYIFSLLKIIEDKGVCNER